MESHPDNEVRDAVIKLETKMEQMTASITSMAASVEKLADIRFDIREVRKEVDNNFIRCKEHHTMLQDKIDINRDNDTVVETRVKLLEEAQLNNTRIISNITKLSWTVLVAVVTGSIGLFFYLVKAGIVG